MTATQNPVETSTREDSIHQHSTVVVVPDQVSSNIGDESVILQLDSGVYYGLNAVGTRIWSLMQTPVEVSAIRDTLIEEFDVEPQRCEDELLTLLNDMAAAGLIRVSDE